MKCRGWYILSHLTFILDKPCQVTNVSVHQRRMPWWKKLIVYRTDYIFHCACIMDAASIWWTILLSHKVSRWLNLFIVHHWCHICYISFQTEKEMKKVSELKVEKSNTMVFEKGERKKKCQDWKDSIWNISGRWDWTETHPLIWSCKKDELRIEASRWAVGHKEGNSRRYGIRMCKRNIIFMVKN